MANSEENLSISKPHSLKVVREKIFLRLARDLRSESRFSIKRKGDQAAAAFLCSCKMKFGG